MNSFGIVNFFKKYDYTFFGTCSVIFLIGVLNLYSATHSSVRPDLYQTQILRFLLAIGVGFVVSLINPKNLFRFSYPVYFFNVFLLILVLVMGHEGMGARRWLVLGPIRIQPSELMKISVIMVLGRWFAVNRPDKNLGFRQLIVPSIIAFVPAILTIMEPDLGTGLLILLISFTICFYRKLKWKTIAIIVFLGLVSGTAMYKYGLRDYQRKRIITFLDPTSDPKGAGYNAIQSKIAIGSGQIIGKGFKKSSQASLNYLPENHTDFVFSIYNEEHGFFGSLLLLALYLLLFFRFISLSTSVTKLYESILAIGLMSIFFWHTFINMSMVMGLMPIVGLPLPLMSYGGSSLLTFGICCGLATSISNYRTLF